jgi:hypothetical protein
MGFALFPFLFIFSKRYAKKKVQGFVEANLDFSALQLSLPQETAKKVFGYYNLIT